MTDIIDYEGQNLEKWPGFEKARGDGLYWAHQGWDAAVRKIAEDVDSCADERLRLEFYDAKHLEAAKAIKESDHWAENHWPSTYDRIWYVEAQEALARLRVLRDALWHVIAGWSNHDEECPCVTHDAEGEQCNCGYTTEMQKLHELWC